MNRERHLGRCLAMVHKHSPHDGRTLGMGETYPVTNMASDRGSLQKKVDLSDTLRCHVSGREGSYLDVCGEVRVRMPTSNLGWRWVRGAKNLEF